MVILLCALNQRKSGKGRRGQGRGEKKMGIGSAKERGKIIPTFWGFMTSTEEDTYAQNILIPRSQFAPLELNELHPAASLLYNRQPVCKPGGSRALGDQVHLDGVELGWSGLHREGENLERASSGVLTIL